MPNQQCQSTEGKKLVIQLYNIKQHTSTKQHLVIPFMHHTLLFRLRVPSSKINETSANVPFHKFAKTVTD